MAVDRKAIQRILDYIEDNLKAEISVEELSDLAGFSLFHFYYMELMRLVWGIK